MKLSAPKQITFWIAVAFAVLGILGKLVTIPFITNYATILVVIGFIILAVGNIIDGL